ncbi:B4GALT1 [Branchiostoma lanceolatum]|uniref:Beta-1,4-galactosyltransferase n=1 Tax=Branchiostoma lanceolatum TaxID=7740 RepID=A0A8K0A9T6_BRALA|nr:B4GALT1 [Branchiostoma lanceolatum]
MWRLRSRWRYLVCLQIVGSFCLAAYVLGTTKHTREEEATPITVNRGLGSTEHHIFKAVGGAEPPTQNNKLQTSTVDTVFQQLPDVERGNDPSPVTVKLSSRKQLGLINARQFAVESGSLDVPLGGKWRPPTTDQSVSSEKIAVLVPYRDREEHLKTFLSYIHPFLQRQGRHYGIYVVEQHGDEPLFCKGLLFNIAFNAALDDDDYDCFIFHDVDLIPEDDRNLYTCRESPRHLSVAINKFNYTLPYEQLFGGVTALKTSHYKQLNGYSNLFCGWGGEDDDMFKRLYRHKLRVSRPDKDVARYKMLRHSQTPLNPARYSLLKTSMKRASEDGLSSLETMGYQITSTSRKRYFSHILVNIADRNVRRVLRRLPRHVKRV